MTIEINNSYLDLEIVYSTIKNNSKIEAIKYVKTHANVDLKESKLIVDNLADNPYYYDGETEIIITKPILENKLSKKSKRKGNHVLSQSNSNLKTYLIFGLAVIILFLVIKSYN